MSLRAQELRIGNFISKGQGTVWNVAGILGNTIFSGGFQLPLSEFEPIPLTEEWLVKLGFFRKEEMTSEHFFGGLLFQHSNADEFVIMFGEEYHFIRDQSSSEYDGSAEYRTTEIQYVHQLQNVFYALTGEELTIKE